ncbi:BppU family phage baseplate upper protein [Natronincola ferrireducens]|nr:BppU family phage baseplate upper protein [Natronincola ferrireducens]
MEALKVLPFEIVSQDLNSNKLNITLVKDGTLEPYTLSGTTVVLYFKREDDERYQQYATITNAAQGQIEIVLDVDIIAKRGNVFAEVAVYTGEEMKCTSQLFGFRVRDSINNAETHVSGNALPDYRREMQRLETILDNLIISAGDSNPEIVAARYSFLEGMTFTTLGDRLDFIESKTEGHINKKIENEGIHGIRVEEGELEFLVDNVWKRVSGMEPHGNDFHDPAFETKADADAHKAESASKHIKESGSNANGKYIKFDDGTMICSIKDFRLNTINGSSGATDIRNTWTFPALFVDNNIIVHMTGGTAARLGSETQTSDSFVIAGSTRAVPTPSTCICSVFQREIDFFAGNYIDQHLLATGRWK